MPIRKRLIGENGLMASFVALPNNVNGAGTAGTNVTTSLATSFQDGYGVGTLPPDYVVQVTPSSPAIASVTGNPSGDLAMQLRREAAKAAAC
jgi:hypothetical protein